MMKMNTTAALLGAALTIGSVQASVIATADFDAADATFSSGGSATTVGADTTLNGTSTGGTWSNIGTDLGGGTDSGSTIVGIVGNELQLGNTANGDGVGWPDSSPATSTARFTLDSAATLAGATIDFDFVRSGNGGGLGQFYIDIFSGGTQILRISSSTDAGEGRGDINHWTAVDGTRTGLSAEDTYGIDTSWHLNIALSATDFGVKIDDGALGVDDSGLAYFAGTGGITTFDAIEFTAWKSKPKHTIDDLSISAVPEPSSAALLGLGGLALILRRRK